MSGDKILTLQNRLVACGQLVFQEIKDASGGVFAQQTRD